MYLSLFVSELTHKSQRNSCLRSGYTDVDRQNQESQLDFVSGVEDEGIVIESELDENSEWHQVHYTTRRNDQVQSFERGLTPLQVTQNRGDMPE